MLGFRPPSRAEAVLLGAAWRGHRALGAHAPVDEFPELVLVGGVSHGHVLGDLAPQHQIGKALVEGLHPELELARLHGAVDLVDLVLPNQVADGRIGDHDLQRQGPALSAGLGDERLADDALQHQR